MQNDPKKEAESNKETAFQIYIAFVVIASSVF